MGESAVHKSRINFYETNWFTREGTAISGGKLS